MSAGCIMKRTAIPGLGKPCPITSEVTEAVTEAVEDVTEAVTEVVEDVTDDGSESTDIDAAENPDADGDSEATAGGEASGTEGVEPGDPLPDEIVEGSSEEASDETQEPAGPTLIKPPGYLEGSEYGVALVQTTRTKSLTHQGCS
jgi:hypothetical protein